VAVDSGALFLGNVDLHAPNITGGAPCSDRLDVPARNVWLAGPAWNAALLGSGGQTLSSRPFTPDIEAHDAQQ
jgi:hypothetical protein